jgi:hypothetical protein
MRRPIMCGLDESGEALATARVAARSPAASTRRSYLSTRFLRPTRVTGGWCSARSRRRRSSTVRSVSAGTATRSSGCDLLEAAIASARRQRAQPRQGPSSRAPPAPTGGARLRPSGSTPSRTRQTSSSRRSSATGCQALDLRTCPPAWRVAGRERRQSRLDDALARRAGGSLGSVAGGLLTRLARGDVGAGAGGPLITRHWRSRSGRPSQVHVVTLPHDSRRCHRVSHASAPASAPSRLPGMLEAAR